MTEPAPAWAVDVPSAPGIHNEPDMRGGAFVRPFTPAQLLEIGAELIEQFLRKVALAVLQFVPGGVAAFDLLSDWSVDIQNNLSNLFGRLDDLIGDLLNNTADVLGSIPQHLVSGLQSTISVINNAVSGANSFIQNVINEIWKALRRVPVLGGFIPKPADLNQAITDTQAQQQSFVISAIVSDYRNPSWMCRYPIGDVVYPEVQNARLGAFGVTGAQSAGTAHTHVIAGANAFAVASFWGIDPGEAGGAFITVTNTTVFDTVGVIAWRDDVALNNCFLEVFGPAADGSMTLIMSHNISALLTLTESYIEVALPELLVVQHGEQYLVRVRNNSTVPGLVWVQGIRETLGMEEYGFYTTGAAATQTSYSAAEVEAGKAATNVRRWALLACKNMPSTDRLYQDDANRSAIGGLWIGKSSTAALINIYDRQFGYTGAADGHQSALYIHPTSRVGSRVEAQLTLNPLSTAREGVLLHCSRNFSQVVYLGVNGTSAKIFSGPWGSLTERASLNVGGSGQWSLYYDEPADKYVALKDGSDIGLWWTSVGSAVEHDSNHLYGGIRIEMLDAQPAGTIDNWALQDWLIAVPVTVLAPPMEAAAAMGAATVAAGVKVDAPPMEAAASMSADVHASVKVDAPAMETTAAMGDTRVSNNTEVPYSVPWEL